VCFFDMVGFFVIFIAVSCIVMWRKPR